jgi:hypothetical protein
MDMERLTRAYVNIRNARRKLAADFKKQDDDLKAKLDLLDVELLKQLRKTKQQSARTKSGTAYLHVETNYAAENWDKVLAWAIKNDEFEILQKRLNKTFLTNYMEGHKGKLPPFIKVHSEQTVKVRTANEKD